MDINVSMQTPLDGHKQRRGQTRARLIAAARTVMGQKGADAVPISDITDAAGLGKGSFYNHFSSREELIEAVFEETVTELGSEIQSLGESMDDPAERLAFTIRYAMTRSLEDEETARFFVRGDSGRGMIGRHIEPSGWRDVHHGMASGRFQCDDLGVLGAIIAGGSEAIMRGVIEGELSSSESISGLAGSVLILLGINAQEAKAIANQALPVSNLEQ
ncbi:MAG: TetR/AcrR family transcriptional regulator [Pseudomonadota bacterium]